MLKPTYSLTTFGCQMNVHDSERIAGLLVPLGFVTTEDESRADVIIVNTCSVRQSAENRVFGSQEKYLRYKLEKPNMIVAVTGCMPGRDKEKKFLSRLPATDLYFPITYLPQLPRWIAELRPDLVNTGIYENDYLKIHPLRAPKTQAFVTIQIGCDKYCSYCVVPYARGHERERTLQEILDECRELISQGVLEITLLGQAVNTWKALDVENFSSANPFHDHFAALLWEINRLDGLARLHWTAAHPLFMTEEVIAALGLPKQVRYLHLPVQSGNNEILRRMNRKYTREQYLQIIQRIKTAHPNLALGTDIIVGFCGETHEQFGETLSLYREADFDIGYLAQYSQREGTLAAKIFVDDVSREEKRRRWGVLQALMEETTLRKNEAFVGKNMRILVEKVENGWAFGTSAEMKVVRFPTADPSLIGKIVTVKIFLAKTWVLFGSLIAFS